MEPVKIGDLVLGWNDKQSNIIGIVVDCKELNGFKSPYQSRWYIEWPDGVRSGHGINIVRMMKEDLKRFLTEEGK